jgi:hypothetical protein
MSGIVCLSAQLCGRCFLLPADTRTDAQTQKQCVATLALMVAAWRTAEFASFALQQAVPAMLNACMTLNPRDAQSVVVRSAALNHFWRVVACLHSVPFETLAMCCALVRLCVLIWFIVAVAAGACAAARGAQPGVRTAVPRDTHSYVYFPPATPCVYLHSGFIKWPMIGPSKS